MKYCRRLAMVIAVAFTIIACSPQQKPPLKIVTNSWIGYAPLYYARQKGLLKPLNINLVNVVSLGESRQLYETGLAMAFTGTQYEYFQSYKKDRALMPVMMFDRSNGGDMVLANRDLQALKNTDKTLQAYLEMDSVNRVLLKDFLTQNGLAGKRIHYNNMDQARISTLHSQPGDAPMIIVTYIPYNQTLLKQGFQELASTRNNQNLLIVDALYTSQQVFKQHKQQFIDLKKIVDVSIAAIDKDPKDFYQTVKSFIDNPGYQTFLSGLKDIAWINRSMDEPIRAHLKQSGFPVRDLLQ